MTTSISEAINYDIHDATPDRLFPYHFSPVPYHISSGRILALARRKTP